MTLKNSMAALGAALLAGALAWVGWLAVRNAPAPDASVVGPVAVADAAWEISPQLREQMLAELPAQFERRAGEARANGRSVLPLSAFTIEFRPRWFGKRPLVHFEDRCDPAAAASAQKASLPADATPEPVERDAFLQTCLLSGTYDPEQHRYVLVTFGHFQPPYRSAPLDCGSRPFTAMTRLADLPPDILMSLDDPADHDEPFQATDAIRPGAGKSRRFVLAAIDKDLAFVAVEHGGIGYYVEIWQFERRDGHWDGEIRRMGGTPNSLQALLHDTCVGVPYPPLREYDKGELTASYVEPNGDMHLIVADEPGGGYVLHPHLVGSDEVLTEGAVPRPLSLPERHELRARLLKLQSEILPDWPAHDVLVRFVKALASD